MRSWQIVPRLDIPQKVTGGTPMCRTLRLPGWPSAASCGRHAQAPSSTRRHAAVKAMPGVLAVVRDGSFLGVVAEREEQAITARKALCESAKWTGGPELPDPAKIYDVLLALPAEDTVISEKSGRRRRRARS